MKKLTLLTLVALCAAVWTASADRANPTADPKADPNAVVATANARFTVLTPSLIRMEWSADGVFEDNATLGIINRRLAVPAFKKSVSKNRVTISTDQVKLTYTGQAKFSPENLKVEFTLNGKKQTWKPEMAATGNLKGTTRTLDKCNGWNPIEPFEDGIISRDGWAVVDESARHTLQPDQSRWGEWVAERNAVERQDLYIFAYGHRYTEAIKDFTLISGQVPLPPKYAFGYWWSRYWEYSDSEIRDLAQTLRSLDIPLDVMVIDMDWHETWGLKDGKTAKDEYGQRKGWTGYTWQKELFPNPKNLLTWLHNHNLKTTLNIHPASGIQPYESVYDEFCKKYGWQEKGKPIPYRLSEQKWADTYFNTVLHPNEDMGVDFWWTDWQQWKESKYCKGLNNTFWLNYCEFNDMAIRNKELRPLIYHRWGGLGSHRYQIAFSGDTHINWNTFSFIPYFTATASNVCYGYWGHDIGGHYRQATPTTDPELLTRWLQFGVFTPIFKTHCTKDATIERRPWQFPNHMMTMRAAIRLRYSLSPYIYSAARTATDTGISICRPMYYEYPETEAAYDAKNQYMFGRDILAAAICSPADTTTEIASVKVWFPEGDWYDMSSGRMIKGGDYATLHYTVNENPYFVKAGTVIPMAGDKIMNLQQPSDELVLTVAPAGGDFSTTLYEDDGVSNHYSKEFATTLISKHSEANTVTVRVMPRQGSFAGMAAERHIELRFEATYAPQSVKVNGKELQYARYAADGEWTYDGDTFATVVRAGHIDCSQELTVECVFTPEQIASQSKLYGKKGLCKRFFTLTSDFKYAKAKFDQKIMLPLPYLKVASLASFAAEAPDKLPQFLAEFDANLPQMFTTVDAMEKLDGGFKQKLHAWVEQWQQ